MTKAEYLALITSAFREKPKFAATVGVDVDIPVRVQELLKQILDVLFDLDTAAGAQLDIIGKWVGISRNVSIPIEDVFFTWDGTLATGWDFGIWQPNLAPTTVTVLPDDSYRTLIKAKIAANRWDGTTDGAYAIWDSLFTNFTILIQDHQDMSYDLAIVGGIVDSLTAALITGGYIPLKPEGVRVNEYLIPIDSGPAFAWDLEDTLLQGWDEGSWLRQVPPT